MPKICNREWDRLIFLPSSFSIAFVTLLVVGSVLTTGVQAFDTNMAMTRSLPLGLTEVGFSSDDALTNEEAQSIRGKRTIDTPQGTIVQFAIQTAYETSAIGLSGVAGGQEIVLDIDVAGLKFDTAGKAVSTLPPEKTGVIQPKITEPAATFGLMGDFTDLEIIVLPGQIGLSIR